MEKLKLLLLLLGYLYGNSIVAQEGKYHSKWYFKVSTGFSAPLNHYTPAGRSDFLLNYSDASAYFQFISATFWLTRKWGVEFFHAIHTSQFLTQQDIVFKSSLENEYGQQFFIKPVPYLQNESGGIFDRIWLGTVYRIETPKLLLLPRIAYGGTRLRSGMGGVFLKEKDGNTLLTLDYRNTAEVDKDHPTIITGVTGLYRLSKKFLLGLDVHYTHLKLNLEYEEQLRNVFTDQTFSRSLFYKDSLHSLTFGLGLIYEVRYFSVR